MIQKIYNANLYINGRRYLGQVDEITLPKLTAQTQEHKPLSQFGIQEFTSGMQKLELDLKFNSATNEVLTVTQNFLQSQFIMIRGNRTTHDAIGGKILEEPVVVFATGVFKEGPDANLKSQESPMLNSKMAISTYRLEVLGKTLVNYDVANLIYEVNGIDLLAVLRANIL